MSGLAADITWSDADGGILTIESGAAVAVTISQEGETLRVRSAGSEATAPATGDVRVLIDGPVLEVSSAAGLFGAAIRPAGGDLTITATTGGLDVFRLA